jgi:hypothetical protein
MLDVEANELHAVRSTDRRKTQADACRTLSVEEREEIERQLQAQGYLRALTKIELQKLRMAHQNEGHRP